MNPLNAYLAQSVIEERYAQAEQYRRTHPPRLAVVPPAYEAVTIRRVTPADQQAVELLADLEGRSIPEGAALLAEVDESVLAVRSLENGAIIANPFQPTAELARLLNARAQQLDGHTPSAVTRPFRRAAARMTAMARH